MKRHAKPVLILMLLGALVALAKEIVTDYDQAADFQQYKTYSWMRVKAGVFSLAQAAKAHARLERGDILGRIVLQIRRLDK